MMKFYIYMDTHYIYIYIHIYISVASRIISTCWSFAHGYFWWTSPSMMSLYRTMSPPRPSEGFAERSSCTRRFLTVKPPPKQEVWWVFYGIHMDSAYGFLDDGFFHMFFGIICLTVCAINKSDMSLAKKHIHVVTFFNILRLIHRRRVT